MELEKKEKTDNEGEMVMEKYYRAIIKEDDEIIKKDYPGLSRGVLKKAGTTTSGIYNQNLNGKSVLIEIGGVDNSIDEVNNTVEVVSIALAKIIKGEI